MIDFVRRKKKIKNSKMLTFRERFVPREKLEPAIFLKDLKTENVREKSNAYYDT